MRKPKGRPRILHIEDDQSVLDVIAESIGSDVTIVPATTLREARHLLSQEPFDLIILDVALPDGSGLDLLADLPMDISVVLFSAMEVDLALNNRIKAILDENQGVGTRRG